MHTTIEAVIVVGPAEIRAQISSGVDSAILFTTEDGSTVLITEASVELTTET